VSKKQQFTLVIVATPPNEDQFGRSPTYRPKGLLKTALRQFGFRCIRLEAANLDSKVSGTVGGN
jgi:hypothetical protein